MPQTPLSKKTKAEILEEYKKLQESYEELKMTSRVINEPKNLELLEKVKDYSVDNLTKSVFELKTALNNTLNELSDKLFAEAKKFSEIQKAIELSRQNLKLHYNIQVAAETLSNLVKEHQSKKQQFEEEMENTKRDWARAQEEHEYNTKRQRKRDDDIYEEQRQKKEQMLQVREENLKNQEAELQNLRQQVESFPEKLEKAVRHQAEETTKQNQAKFNQELESAKKDWQSQKNIYEMKIANLETHAKTLNSQITALKQEAERANKKAQELAVKIIESGSIIIPKKEEPKPAQDVRPSNQQVS